MVAIFKDKEDNEWPEAYCIPYNRLIGARHNGKRPYDVELKLQPLEQYKLRDDAQYRGFVREVLHSDLVNCIAGGYEAHNNPAKAMYRLPDNIKQMLDIPDEYGED